MLYGYARVSSKDQNLDRQIALLIENGVEERNIFKEKKSGKNFQDREEYQKLLNVLNVGDTVILTELDRLGRNMQEIEKEYNRLVVGRGCNLKFLKEDFLSTTSSGDNPLFRDVVQPILLKLMGYMAQKEREKTLQRQRDAYNNMEKDAKGRLITKAGKVIGRQARYETLKEDEKKLIKDWINGKISCLRVSKILTISRPTLYKIKKEYLEEEIKL
ncbi:recombinase family protein [Fusobacterium polymorphum]|uniref:recombinase family protein n=1 Tax=Fusobacterium nucleatum subsp. polymorphum TaxID=76857 RepID=UPI000C1B1DCC|nr:recombinase family protein [Fusobacterium polymorphum]PIM74525.1 recombinase [Fusobacterium polymorphum]